MLGEGKEGQGLILHKENVSQRVADDDYVRTSRYKRNKMTIH